MARESEVGSRIFAFSSEIFLGVKPEPYKFIYNLHIKPSDSLRDFFFRTQPFGEDEAHDDNGGVVKDGAGGDGDGDGEEAAKVMVEVQAITTAMVIAMATAMTRTMMKTMRVAMAMMGMLTSFKNGRNMCC